ncbi:MAG TPA: hypothetical protein VMK12_14755 [Anaeromyxobacteraceae bacterium]|nr:hypothetical protein [Anaeromyxobacteraceae bacterium]
MVAAVRVDVLEASGRQVGHVVVAERAPFGAELVDDAPPVWTVLQRVGDQVQTLGLVGLLLQRPAPDLALVRQEEEVPERVHRLALAELDADAATEGFVLEVPQDEDRLDEPPRTPAARVSVFCRR